MTDLLCLLTISQEEIDAVTKVKGNPAVKAFSETILKGTLVLEIVRRYYQRLAPCLKPL